jgi:hypothetical protein
VIAIVARGSGGREEWHLAYGMCGLSPAAAEDFCRHLLERAVASA